MTDDVVRQRTAKPKKVLSGRFTHGLLKGKTDSSIAIPNFDQINFNETENTIDTSQLKWARNDHLVETVHNIVNDDISYESIANLQNVLYSPRTVKSLSNTIHNGNNNTTEKFANTSGKSARFFKRDKNTRESKKEAIEPVIVSNSKSKTPFLQAIDLREIEICQQLGKGASSAGVFLCLVDGWACAMKQLKKEHVCSFDIQCFEREMDILYRLPPHPNIVRYLFHTSIGSDLCLFMQLYSGTLREFLDIQRKANAILPPNTITAMALEVAYGVQFLHSHGVIHRDIKAGNIFITKNEKEEVTRLAIGDFDTSLRISASLKNLKAKDDIIRDVKTNNPTAPPLNTAQKRNLFAQNRPKSTVGTVGFMAPEVFLSGGETPYGFKADVYSFGMLLYEMITLKLPYEQLDRFDIIDAVKAGETVESMSIDQDTQRRYPHLVDLYHQCTLRTPEKRPSLDEIIDKLSSSSSEQYVRVERKQSLIDQLNKYSTNADPISEPTFTNLGNSIDVSKKPKQPRVKFGGPKSIIPESDAKRVVTPIFKTSSTRFDPDAIIRDQIERNLSDITEDDMSSSSVISNNKDENHKDSHSKLQRFKSFKFKTKKDKERKEKKMMKHGVAPGLLSDKKKSSQNLFEVSEAEYSTANEVTETEASEFEYQLETSKTPKRKAVRKVSAH